MQSFDAAMFWLTAQMFNEISDGALIEICMTWDAFANKQNQHGIFAYIHTQNINPQRERKIPNFISAFRI